MAARKASRNQSADLVVRRKLLTEEEWSTRRRSAELLPRELLPTVSAASLHSQINAATFAAGAPVPEFEYPWNSILQEVCGAIPIRLNEGLALEWPPSPFHQSFRTTARVLLADAKGRFFMHRFNGEYLIVLDRDRLLLLVLQLYYAWRRGRGGATIAFWIFAYNSLEPTDRFPELETFAKIAWERDPTVFAWLCQVVALLIIGHEIGHEYLEQHSHEFLRIVPHSKVMELPLKSRLIGEWGHVDFFANVLHREDGSQELIIPDADIFPNGLGFHLKEQACDVFAAWAALLVARAMQPDGPANSTYQNCLASVMLWQLVLFNFHTQSMWRVTKRARTHPPSRYRYTVIHFHLYQHICTTFHQDWCDSMVAPSLERIYELLRAEKMHRSSLKAIEFLYQFIDRVSPESNLERFHEYRQGYCLSLFESLWWELVGPQFELAAMPIELAGQSKAASKRLDQILERSFADYTCTWSNKCEDIEVVIEQFAAIGKQLRKVKLGI